MTSATYYLEPAQNADYQRKLMGMATLREAMDLADQVILSACITMIDPYDGTNEASRERLLENYPIHSTGSMKRAIVFSMTGAGYSDAQDREKMKDIKYFKYKPFLPHFPESDQEIVLEREGFAHPGLVSTHKTEGAERIYTNGQILGDRAEVFALAQQEFDGEIDLHAEAFESCKRSPHILSTLLMRGFVLYCPTPYLQAAMNTGYLTKDEVLNFVNAQVAFIESEVKACLERKNKGERNRTTMCRQFLEAYASFKRDNLGIADESVKSETA